MNFCRKGAKAQRRFRKFRNYLCAFAPLREKTYLGDPAGLAVAGELVTDALGEGACVGDCVGALPSAAGRSPRLPGLFSMLEAR